MKKPNKVQRPTFFGKKLKFSPYGGIPRYLGKLVEVSPCGPRPDGRNWVAMYRFNDMAHYGATPRAATEGLEKMVLKDLKQAAKSIGYTLVAPVETPDYGYVRPRGFARADR